MNLEEFVARALAAKKMGLERDPYGLKLSDDLWRQSLWDAQFVLHLIREFELRKVVEDYHNGEDEGGSGK